MKLNYYLGDELHQVEIFSACPGCGKMKSLAMYVIPVSPVKRIHKFYVRCLCGWQGPEMDQAEQAALLWDARTLTEIFHGEISNDAR